MERWRGSEEKDKKLLRLLGFLETSLKSRVVRAPTRSPETLFDELAALDLVIGLQKEIRT